MTSASAELEISQPALTKNMKRLEEKYGVPLFERHSKGVALTKYGEVFLHRAKRIEMEQRHLQEELSAITQGYGGNLRIGAGLVWAMDFLPPVVTKMYEAYPQLKLTLTSGSTLDLLQKMHCGELDIVLAGNTTQIDQSSDYNFIPLINIDFVVVVREGHPLRGKNLVTAEELKGYSWVVLSQSSDAADNINDFYLKHNLPPATISFESSYLETALTVVQNSDHLMLLPKRMYNTAKQHGLSHLPVNDKVWGFASGIWTDPSVDALPALATFTEFLKDECASLHF